MATVTKKELVDRIADATGEKRGAVKEVVQTLLDRALVELARGNRIELRDFGVFEVKRTPAREALNPRTLTPVRVGPRPPFRYGPNEPEPTPEPGELPAADVQDLLVDRTGRLWIATRRGLAWFDGDHVEIVTDRLPRIAAEPPPFDQWAELPPEARELASQLFRIAMMQQNITALIERRDGVIFIGARLGVIAAYDPDEDRFELVHMPADPERAMDHINEWIADFAEGPDGGLVAAVRGLGLLRIVDNRVETLPLPADWAPSRQTLALAYDDLGDLWLGTTEGLGRWRADGELERFSAAEGHLDHGGVSKLEIDGHGRVWAVTWHGVAVHDHGQWRYPDFGLSHHDRVLVVNHTADGRLWVSHGDGVVRDPPVQWHDERRVTRTLRDHRAEIERAYPDIATTGHTTVDHRGRVWTTVLNRLLVYDGQRWDDRTAKAQGAPISFVHADRRQRIWIGTSGRGVMSVADGQTEWFNDTPDHSRSVVYTMTEADDGTLYFGTQHGLYRLVNARWEHVTDRYQVYRIVVDDRGRVWFADSNFGLVLYDAGEVRELTPRYPPLEQRMITDIESVGDGTVRVVARRRGAVDDKLVVKTDGVRFVPADQEP